MLVIKDFATTTLASALTAVATTITVSDASRLPALTNGDYFYLVLQKFVDRSFVEIVKVTGVAGNVLTVVRAQGGTSGKAFSIGDYAELRVTVDTFAEYIQQSIAGKVDKVGGVVMQSLGLLNAADLVQAAVSIAYDVTNGHGTILSGGEGANKITPYLALRPLGKSDASRELKYDTAGTLTLTGGSRVIVSGMLLSTHLADANGWPNAINSDPNNYINRARSRIAVDNNALHFIGDGATNSRRLGIQAGHASAPYATSYGILELNPYGGAVKVNGGTVYHTGYVPTPAAVGALPLVGGTLTGALSQNIAGYGIQAWAAGSTAYLSGGKADGNTSDQKLRISGINGTQLTSLEILTATHGLATINGARIYTEQYVPTPDVIGAVPQARTINGKPLTSDIVLSVADVGALPYNPTSKSALVSGFWIDGGLDVDVFNGVRRNNSYLHFYADATRLGLYSVIDNGLGTSPFVRYLDDGRMTFGAAGYKTTVHGSEVTVYTAGSEKKVGVGAITSDAAQAIEIFTLNAPAGAVAGTYYPVLVPILYQGDFISINTVQVISTNPINNCSFNGYVRAKGWSDGTSGIDGIFTQYDMAEKGIYNCMMPTEASEAVVFYVEARAFPVTIRKTAGAFVPTTGTSITAGSSVFNASTAPGPAAGTKIATLVTFSRGTGQYSNYSDMTPMYETVYDGDSGTGGTLTINLDNGIYAIDAYIGDCGVYRTTYMLIVNRGANACCSTANGASTEAWRRISYNPSANALVYDGTSTTKNIYRIIRLAFL